MQVVADSWHARSRLDEALAAKVIKSFLAETLVSCVPAGDATTADIPVQLALYVEPDGAFNRVEHERVPDFLKPCADALRRGRLLPDSGPRGYRVRFTLTVGPISPEVPLHGRLAPERIIAVIDANRDLFTTCYRAEVAKIPGISGVVETRFVIGPSGDVSHARVTDSTLYNSNVMACVASMLRTLTFPQPQGDGAVVATHAFTFAPVREAEAQGRPARSKKRTALGWSLIGTGVGTAVLGGFMYLQYAVFGAQAQTVTVATSSGPQTVALPSNPNTAYLVTAITSSVSSLALIIAGIVVLTKEEPAVAWSLFASPQGASLAFSGHF